MTLSLLRFLFEFCSEESSSVLAASLVHETNLRWVAEVLQPHLHSPSHHMPEEHGLILRIRGSENKLLTECSARILRVSESRSSLKDFA